MDIFQTPTLPCLVCHLSELFVESRTMICGFALTLDLEAIRPRQYEVENKAVFRCFKIVVLCGNPYFSVTICDVIIIVSLSVI